MKKPDFNLLPIAFALYHELSVGRAARRLGMTQPAVSMALKRIRIAFDDPLFVRVPSGITPTPRAHAIVRVARPLLGRLQQDLLHGETFDAASSTHTFTLALSDVGEMAFLPRLVACLRARAPHCNIRSASVLTRLLAHELETGEIDLAIGYFPALSPRSVRQRRVSTQHWSIGMRDDHPLRTQPMTVAAFQSAEHLVVRAEGRPQEVLERFLERRRIRRNVALMSPHFLSVPFLVSSSDFIATIPHSVALHFSCQFSKLVAVAPPFEPPTFDLKFHWHRRFDNEARSGWLREQLGAVFRENPTMPRDELRGGIRAAALGFFAESDESGK